MKQRMIKLQDVNIKWVDSLFNKMIDSGFYIKSVSHVEKTTFLVLVEAKDLDKCYKSYEDSLMDKMEE